MTESLAANSVLPNILLHLLTLHECKVAIHILNGNQTQADLIFVNEIIYELPIPTLVQDISIDSSDETSVFGKACFMSFSETALVNVQYAYKRKRPIKILLGTTYYTPYEKTDYEPIIIESPPIISLKEATLSSGN